MIIDVSSTLDKKAHFGIGTVVLSEVSGPNSMTEGGDGVTNKIHTQTLPNKLSIIDSFLRSICKF